MAAERGALGLLTWLSIWVAYFWRAFLLYRDPRTRDGPARALLVGSIAAVAGFLAAGLFECNYRDSEVSNLLYAAMALAFCSVGEERASRESARSIARMFSR